MKKVIVIGCPGSGKSTFSKALHKITDIPLFHLNMIFWNADKTTVGEKTIKTEKCGNKANIRSEKCIFTCIFTMIYVYYS